MWNGYFEIGGVEIINVARTEAYATRAGLSWFLPAYECDGLRLVLGDDPYVDPVSDIAPWYDPRIPHSADFYGVYPLDVTGLDDATTFASAQEAIGNGGVATQIRRTTKTGVFTALLIAVSDAGAEYGKAWLTRALMGPCGPDDLSDGLSATYLAAEPVVGPWNDDMVCSGLRAPRSADPYVVSQLLTRQLRRCTTLVGPQITAKQATSDRGMVANVTFTVSAGNGFEYGLEFPFIEGWLDPGQPSPWPTGVPPAGASITGPTTYTEEECLPETYTPIYDPLCAGVIPPPSTPNIDWECYTAPATWQRRQAILPANLVPGYTDLVPVITFAAATVEARRVRIRIYADRYATGVLDSSAPCDFVADFVVAYIPAEHTMTFDAVDQLVYVDSPEGVRRKADSLVFGSDGGPFEWPSLTCGIQHIIVLDLDATETAPYVSISLVERIG